MAKTYGDTKYMDWSVRTIDSWFNQSAQQGWVIPGNQAQTQLETGVIASAIAQFALLSWTDNRFAQYRTQADAYVTKLIPMLKYYDIGWIDGAPYAGSPSFWRYMNGGTPYGAASLLMYNQGAIMAHAMLLITDIQKIKGQTPDAAFLDKANKAAAYFKTFAKNVSGAYVWNYSGSVINGEPVEDNDHGHLDLRMLVAAKKHNIGGITDADIALLGGTLAKVIGSGGIAHFVDGTGATSDAWSKVAVAIDWIDLAENNPALLDKVVSAYNQNGMQNNLGSRFFLGMAELQRVKAGVRF